MKYLTAKQFSEKWGITERRIIKLCQDNRINGAIKNGMVWLIPEDTLKPSDKRNKISKYINTEKRVMIANFDNQIGYELIELAQKSGYIVDGMFAGDMMQKQKIENIDAWEVNFANRGELAQVLQESDKYYEGFIFIDIEKPDFGLMTNKEWFIQEFAKKMNCESSIVLVNNKRNNKEKLERKLAMPLQENIGVRMNSLDIDFPMHHSLIMNFSEIAEDAFDLLTRFKNTTGISITTDGGALEFDENDRTMPLETGKFYRAITNYLKSLTKDSYMWCASTMMEDEWTEEPLEMNFRVTNLEAANRGANMERIFIFPVTKIKEFKKNKTLKLYMQSNIKTMYVDYYEILEKNPKLLKIVGNGWDGIDKSTLLVDLPAGNKERGYISTNEKEVKKAYKCFQELKKYAKDLKEVLK